MPTPKSHCLIFFAIASHTRAYEDAIVQGESWLWHSVLTPSLNTGLLTPDDVVEATLKFANQNDVPLNSLEGFLRQIIGWREFIRATYQDHSVEMRTTNHWQHHRKIPASFYDGTTGILPIDDTIQRVLRTGYCHHNRTSDGAGRIHVLVRVRPGRDLSLVHGDGSSIVTTG